MKIKDITLPIKEKMIYYPGDAHFKKEPICTIAKSGCNMTKITLSTHTGTHLDAPFHFLSEGKSIDELPLDTFVGKAQVIEVKKEKIDAQEIEKHLLADIKRILFKTKNSFLLDKDEFSKDYVYLTEDGADFLIEKGVSLVGIDYISIEKFGTPTFSVHKKLFSKNIPILEGLYLKNVDPGIYFLVALPLPLSGLDGSPVRAILIEDMF